MTTNIIGLRGLAGAGKDTVAKLIQMLIANSQVKPGFSIDEILNETAIGLDTDLEFYSKWQIKKFAFKLKQIVSILTGIPVHLLERQEVKQSTLPDCWSYYTLPELSQRFTNLESIPFELTHLATKHEMTVRQMLQELGTNALRNIVHPDIHINAFWSDYKPVKVNSRKSTWKGHSILNGMLPEETTNPNWLITDVRFINEVESIKSKHGIIINITRPGLVPMNHPSEMELENYKEFDFVIENDSDIDTLYKKVKLVLKILNLL